MSARLIWRKVSEFCIGQFISEAKDQGLQTNFIRTYFSKMNEITVYFYLFVAIPHDTILTAQQSIIDWLRENNFKHILSWIYFCQHFIFGTNKSIDIFFIRGHDIGCKYHLFHMNSEYEGLLWKPLDSPLQME